MKNIYLLGATGSIGRQTIEVLQSLNDSYRLVSICFGNKLKEALEIINEFKPKLVCTSNLENYNYIKENYPNIDLYYGDEGLVKAAICKYYEDGEDIVINSFYCWS